MPVLPPRPKGPPLNAMRAFEAAARLGGFTLAAEELCVTPGAVSQHVKSLEDWAGTALFERRSHGVRLTRAGAALAPEVTAAFDQMGQATRILQGLRPETTIHIAALPSLAQLWLSPHLPSLRRAFPKVRFSVTGLERTPNLMREMFDWSLFLEQPPDDHGAFVLEEDTIFPVCAPALAKQMRRPEDLWSHPLLIDDSWSQDWASWALAAGLPADDVPSGHNFSLYALALSEACNGGGVLMGHACLVRQALEEGQLVAPFDIRVPTGRALVLRAAGRSAEMAQAFVTSL